MGVFDGRADDRRAAAPTDFRPYPEPYREIGRISLAHEPPLRLGALSIDPALRQVAHDDGREETVEPRVMQVLVALIHAGGQILTRDDLLMSCWRGVVVGEDAINRVIGRLRRLADGVGAGEFELETITKVGYRLLPTHRPAGTAPSPPPSDAPRAARKFSICVLPFANMSDDPQQEYFSDGISEDIITDLSKVSSLFVVARTSAFAFKGQSVDVPQVARQLSVGHVLEGSVRKAGGRVRITAQLIDAATGGHVWAERYDRDLHDIFGLQDEISEAIVEALKLKLLPEEKTAIEQRGTTNPDAYNLYLMARRYYVSGQEGAAQGLEAIERLCRRATEIDAGYARAWALMAIAQMALHFTHNKPGDGGLEAVRRALALDPNLAEAHALNARFSWEQGRQEEALAQIAVALRLDPECWAANSIAARLCYRQRRFEDAIGYWEKATTLTESTNGDPGMLLSSYRAIGDEEGVRRAAQMALARAEKALAREDINGAAMCCGVSALAALGQRERALDLMEHGLLTDPDNMTMRYNFACGIITYLNDVDTALDLLGPVFATAPRNTLRHAEIDPDLDHIRGDPRFQAMIAAAESRLAAANGSGSPPAP